MRHDPQRDAAHRPQAATGSGCALGLAVAVQVVGLSDTALLPPLVACALLAGAGVFCAWRLRPAWRHLDRCAVTAGLGGAGMLLGARLDAWTSGSDFAGRCHAAHSLGAGGLFSFATAGMVVSCLAGCGFLRDHDCARGAGLRLRRHLLGGLGMLIGMWAGAPWLTPGAPPSQASSPWAAHLAMTAAMASGNLLGLLAAESRPLRRVALAVKPGRPFTAGAPRFPARLRGR